MYQLLKSFKLIKPEYDELELELFETPKIERAYFEINSLIFRFKYMSKYTNASIDEYSEYLSQLANHYDNALDKTAIFINAVITKLLNDPIAIKQIYDIYLTNITIDNKEVVVNVGVLSENMAVLETLDEILSADNVQLYP